MDLDKLLEMMDSKPAPGSTDEDVRQFVETVREAFRLKGSVSSGSYEEDRKKMRGDADYDSEEPNKNGDIFSSPRTKEYAEELEKMYAKGLVSKKTVMEQILGGKVQGGPLGVPVRPQQWTRHKPSFDREYALEHEAEHFRDVVFGPFPGDKSEDTVEQLRHLLSQAQANRAQADEHPCDKPCRFLRESVRDSEVSGVPVGVRQRCAHPVFEQRSMYSLLSLYAEMLNVTEKFCEAMVKSNPDVLESLPTARRIALASSQSLLITPRENNRDLIVSYLESLDFLREKVAVVIDDMKKNHALTVSDDRYFTNGAVSNKQAKMDRDAGTGGNENGP